MTPTLPLPSVHIAIMQPVGYVHSLGFVDPARFIRYQLRRFGVDVSIAKNRLRGDAVNIVLGAHLGFPKQWRERHACLFLNLEQLGPRGARVSQEYIELLKTSGVIDYDLANLVGYGADPADVPLIPFRHAPYLESKVADTIRLEDRPIDLLFFGSLNDRRRQLIKRIEACGVQVTSFDHPTYGEERDRYIRQAKAVLNCHFYEASTFEQVRVFHCLSLGTPVIGERTAQTRPDMGFEHAISWFEESNLESFFQDSFGTPAYFESSREKLRTWRAQDPIDAYADLMAFATGYYAGHVQRRPLDAWRPSQINLGSGMDYEPGWLNIDIDERTEPDLIMDLSRSQDFPVCATTRFGLEVVLERGTVEKVRARNSLAHVPDIPCLMSNVLSLLKDGGEIEIDVPYEKATTAWQDPTHIRAMNETSWSHFTDLFWSMGWYEHKFEMTWSSYLDGNLQPCDASRAAFMRVILRKVVTTPWQRMQAQTMQTHIRVPQDEVDLLSDTDQDICETSPGFRQDDSCVPEALSSLGLEMDRSDSCMVCISHKPLGQVSSEVRPVPFEAGHTVTARQKLDAAVSASAVDPNLSVGLCEVETQVDALISHERYSEALIMLAGAVQGNYLTDGVCHQKLYYPGFDRRVEKLARLLGTGETASLVTPSGRDLLIATELYTLGGHSKVLEDLSREFNDPIIVLTDLFDNYHNHAEFFTKIAERFGHAALITIPKASLWDKCKGLRSFVDGLNPRSIWYLAHHEDPVAYVGTLGHSGSKKYFIHHTDHNPSMGCTLEGVHHVDLSPKIRDLCRQALKVDTDLLPMYAQDLGVLNEELPYGKPISVATSGRIGKFTRNGDLALKEIVLACLRAVTGFFYHIGPLDKSWISEIREHLTLHGIETTRFVYRGQVESVWNELLKFEPAFYIGSAPVGGGRASVEAQGCGLPILYFNGHEPGSLVENYSLFPDPSLGWSKVHELEALLRRCTPHRDRMSRTARLHYMENFSHQHFRNRVTTMILKGSEQYTRPFKEYDESAHS